MQLGNISRILTLVARLSLSATPSFRVCTLVVLTTSPTLPDKRWSRNPIPAKSVFARKAGRDWRRAARTFATRPTALSASRLRLKWSEAASPFTKKAFAVPWIGLAQFLMFPIIPSFLWITRTTRKTSRDRSSAHREFRFEPDRVRSCRFLSRKNLSEFRKWLKIGLVQVENIQANFEFLVRE